MKRSNHDYMNRWGIDEKVDRLIMWIDEQMTRWIYGWIDDEWMNERINAKVSLLDEWIDRLIKWVDA